MKIFVAGKSGQLARSLAAINSIHDIHCYGRPELDLMDGDAATAFAIAQKPDAIINAAAYTAVDQAESEEETANQINAFGAAALAKAANDLAVPFLHLSTDYVFDGSKDSPYIESDITQPTGAYGRSKLLGEQMVAAANPNALIFRTAWVYSPYGKNFVKTMLWLAANKDTVSVVGDQVGNPTYAPDIATALINVIDHVEQNGWSDNLAGIYHLAGSGDTSWHDFAAAIFKSVRASGSTAPKLSSITTSQYPTAAIRPANSRLCCKKLEKTFGIKLPHWDESLAHCLITLESNIT